VKVRDILKIKFKEKNKKIHKMFLVIFFDLISEITGKIKKIKLRPK